MTQSYGGAAWAPPYVTPLSSPPEDPQAGVHVARVDELRRCVVGDAPDLRRVRERVALSRLDRVLVRRRHEVRDLLRVARVLRAHDANTVGVPGQEDVRADDQRVVDDVVARARVRESVRIRRVVLADLHGIRRIRFVQDAHVTPASDDPGPGLAEGLIGGEEQLARVVVARRVRVAVLVAPVRKPPEIAGLPRVRNVEADEPRVPVRDEERASILGGIHAVAECDCEAADPRHRVQAEILSNAERRHERGTARIRHVDDPRLTSAGAVAQRHAVGLEALGIRQARVDERLAEIVAVADLELVEAARAAAGVEDCEQHRVRRSRDVPEAEPALAGGGGVRAEDVADLKPDRRDVVSGVGTVLGGEHGYVLVRCARHLGVRDDLRMRRIVDVDHRHAAGRTELRMGRVEETPATDVRGPLVDEHVAVEAAAAEVVLTDGDHVPGRSSLGAVRRVARRRVEEMLLLREQRVVVARGRDADRSGGECGGEHGDSCECLSHRFPPPSIVRGRRESDGCSAAVQRLRCDRNAPAASSREGEGQMRRIVLAVAAFSAFAFAGSATAALPGTCRLGNYNSNHSESWIAVKPGTENLIGMSKIFFEKYSTFYNFHLGAYPIPSGTPTGTVQIPGYDCISTGTQDMPPSWMNNTDPNVDFDTQGR